MIFFDEGFEIKFEVEWKDGRDGFMPRKIIEVVSNLDRSKWDKSDSVEETILIDEKEVSKEFEEVPSSVELDRLFLKGRH